MTDPLRFALLLLLAVVVGAGCDKNETAIRTYSAPRDVPSTLPSDFDATADANSADDADAPVAWTLPQGWKRVPPTSKLEYAAFSVSSEDPKALLTIVQLNSMAVMGNLQRWANQLKLPEVTEADLNKYVIPAQVAGQDALMVTMTGTPNPGQPPTRLYAAMVQNNDEAWTFTLKAPKPIAEAQKPAFDQFIQSIHFPAAAAPDNTAPPAAGSANAAPRDSEPGSAASYKLAGWKLPPGWQEQPGANEFRVTSFVAGAGDEQVQVVVSKIPNGQFGGFVPNVNRWRGEVGLDPVTQMTPGEMKHASVANHPAIRLDFIGPAQGADQARELSVVIDIEGRDFWCFKMSGSASAVASQQAAFQQLLDSLQFQPESH